MIRRDVTWLPVVSTYRAQRGIGMVEKVRPRSNRLCGV